MRKGSLTAVREDQMRIKHEGVEFAVCAYAKGSGGKILNVGASEVPFAVEDEGKGFSPVFETPESFKRRAYWAKENPRYVIVHYLDEAN
jgi:hypothetical protein